jgi:hypothetical protein
MKEIGRERETQTYGFEMLHSGEDRIKGGF